MSETTEQPPRVSMAVIADGDRFLMIRRRQREGKLSWALPGGGIEADESAEQAAVREVAEETALEVKAVKVIGARIHPDTGADMTYVACKVVAGEARVEDAEELAEVAWVSLDEIPAYVPWGLYPPVQEHLAEQLTA
ncbi:NUDIX hydrolase [Streptomyces sp. ISL-66]|uniref:NUDIX hydrolase n=1 Tax=Streptomyces sp. ISL-66 TaxID=2819186 RepID=UPI001BEC1599|nr:NUDIX hydrolase [Streptomyces sp. ISL-66]MBT2467816.1 NUDIX hydrolase [Streptomyces sp. ISL-66]